MDLHLKVAFLAHTFIKIRRIKMQQLIDREELLKKYLEHWIDLKNDIADSDDVNDNEHFRGISSTNSLLSVFPYFSVFSRAVRVCTSGAFGLN